MPHAGRLLGRLQSQPGGVVAVETRAQHPIVQGFERAVVVKTQLHQAGAVARPRLDQRLPGLLDSRIGRAATFCRLFQFPVALALCGLPLRQRQTGLMQLAVAALQQRQLFTARGHGLTQRRGRGIELARGELGQRGQRQCGQRALAELGGHAGAVCLLRRFVAHGQQRLLGLHCALCGAPAGLLFALPAAAGLAGVELLRFHGKLALAGLFLGAFESVGVLVDRVGLQRLLARALRAQGALGLLLRLLGLRLGCRRDLQLGLRPIAFVACIVEIGLRLAQFARLATRQHAGIDAVALVETLHRLGQALEFVELAAVFLQLVEGFGHIGEQRLRHRRQGFGQRMRQAGLVGLFRQLRLAQLDQGVHQRVVTPCAEVEQAFVHRTAVAGGRLEHLATAFEGVAQALAGQHHTLVVGEPEVAADALPAFSADLATDLATDLGIGSVGLLEHEKPTFHLRAGRHRRQAAAQGEKARCAVFGQAAELDPGVTDAPWVAVHQQVPRHFLAAVAVWLDA